MDCFLKKNPFPNRLVKSHVPNVSLIRIKNGPETKNVQAKNLVSAGSFAERMSAGLERDSQILLNTV